MRKSTVTDKQVKEPKKKYSILTEKLYASEIRYRRLFESAKDGILILDAETGKIVDVNPFLIELLGFSKQDFIEKSVWEIGTFKDLYENKDKFLELQQKKYVRYDDLPLQTSTGKEIHVEFVSNVYSEGRHEVIQCNIRDITERRITQNEIKFQADLINNVGQAVIATDLLGKVIYWNNAAEEIYGWSSSEAIGENIMNLTPARQTNEQAIDLMKKLSAGKSWAGEFLVKRKDGSSFPAFVTDTPMLDSNGNLTGIIGISSDVTERYRAEMELIEAKEKAEENDRLKSAFLANMSHEIRTPMNGILGFTELLRTIDLTREKQLKFIGTIEDSGNRLLNLINDIISISKIESNQIETTISDMCLHKEMQNIVDFFRLEAENKNLNISFKNDLPTNETIIKADSKKVYAVLTNLVKNAIKFTQYGFIELGYIKKEGFFELYVKDSGPGILEEQKEIIFERFRQGSEALTRNYEGAGLGLSISKAYVEMMGGKIWVENNAGKNGNPSGATFYFTIPALPVKEPNHVTPGAKSETMTKNAIRKLNILVVENDETSKMLIIKMLDGLSRKILTATTGVEAVELCRKNPDVDLVLMDINMPIMDGYEATRTIRRFNMEVVIIAQTAYALAGDREKSIDAGCNNYVSKPINRDNLRIMISNYFAELTRV